MTSVADPFRWWPKGRAGKQLGWVVAIAAVALNVVLGGIDRQLQDKSGAGIVAFELAANFTRSFEILDGWSSAGLLDDAKRSIVTDYPFLVLYATSLGVAAAGLSRRLSARNRDRWASWGPLVVWAALLAGAADAIENAFLWLQITGGARGRYAFPAFAFATTKFVLLVVVVLYLVVGGVLSLRRPPRAAT